jgi:hypothetical protein
MRGLNPPDRSQVIEQQLPAPLTNTLLSRDLDGQSGGDF